MDNRIQEIIKITRSPQITNLAKSVQDDLDELSEIWKERLEVSAAWLRDGGEKPAHWKKYG